MKFGVDRPRLDMRTNMTSTQSKVKIKVTEFLKFQKLHFSRSISSAILACCRNRLSYPMVKTASL